MKLACPKHRSTVEFAYIAQRTFMCMLCVFRGVHVHTYIRLCVYVDGFAHTINHQTAISFLSSLDSSNNIQNYLNKNVFDFLLLPVFKSVNA